MTSTSNQNPTDFKEADGKTASSLDVEGNIVDVFIFIVLGVNGS